jgi:hypothetical protein
MFDKDGNEIFGFWIWEQDLAVSDTVETDKPEEE